jgi:hypothetical protein
MQNMKGRRPATYCAFWNNERHLNENKKKLTTKYKEGNNNNDNDR